MIAFPGWIQQGDLDCEYATDLFWQLRMCSGEPHSLPPVQLAMICAILLLGLAFLLIGATSGRRVTP
jgi:hypothetical protein